MKRMILNIFFCLFFAKAFIGCGSYTMTTTSFKEWLLTGGTKIGALSFVNNANVEVKILLGSREFLLKPGDKEVISIERSLLSNSSGSSMQMDILVYPAKPGTKLLAAKTFWSIYDYPNYPYGQSRFEGKTYLIERRDWQLSIR